MAKNKNNKRSQPKCANKSKRDNVCFICELILMIDSQLHERMLKFTRLINIDSLRYL